MKTIRFGSVAEFRNGVNYDADGAEACAKVIGVGDFGSLSRLSNFLHIGEIRLSSPLSDQDYLVDGDLLFVRSNGSKKLVGRCMLIENPPALMTHSGFTIRARVDSQKYLPAFVAAIFQTEAIHKQAHLEGTGTNISNLSQQILSGIRLPSFTIQEQLDYLQRVDIWDAAIEKATALLAALEQRKQGLMQQLLTGRRRLKGFKDKWEPYRLDQLFKERNEANHPDLPLLSITRDEGVVRRDATGRKDTSNEDKSAYLRICPGDIGYNTMRMWQGVSALSSLEGIISPAYTVCVPNERSNSRFMAHLFKLPQVVNLFYRYSQGLTSDTWNLKFRHFSEVKVEVPTPDEQKAIAEVLDTQHAELLALRCQLGQLNTQKRALMQKLLSGNWHMPKTALLKEFSV